MIARPARRINRAERLVLGGDIAQGSVMDTQAASAVLYEAWTSGTKLPALPDPLRPRTRAEGYAVQAALAQRAGGAVYGWKIAATNEAGRRHINVATPLAGRMLAHCVLAAGAPGSLAGTVLRVAEPEFAFRMARDLPPRATPYTAREAAEAAASLHPAIEIPDTRFADAVSAGEAQLIADLACGHQFLLGPPAPSSWRRLDLAAHRVSATIGDGPPVVGEGRNVLGDPRVALAWLVNELSGLGITLRAGQVVLAVAPGDVLRADFGDLGRLEVGFA
jgi:2-keto-4-pentenoate hydratase